MVDPDVPFFPDLKYTCPGFQPEVLLRCTEKTIVIKGVFEERPAIAKILRDPASVWADWFWREIDCYLAFEKDGAPIPVPRLLFAHRAHNAFVLDCLSARSLNQERFFGESGADCLPAVLMNIERLSRWHPQVPSEYRVDFESLIQKSKGYESLGYLCSDDMCAIYNVLPHAGNAIAFAHGDLVASNILTDKSGIWFIDWEHAGLKPVCYDVAVLWAMCVHAKAGRVLLAKSLENFPAETLAGFFTCLIAIYGREIGNLTRDSLPDAPRKIACFRGELKAIANLARQERLLQFQTFDQLLAL